MSKHVLIECSIGQADGMPEIKAPLKIKGRIYHACLEQSPVIIVATIREGITILFVPV